MGASEHMAACRAAVHILPYARTAWQAMPGVPGSCGLLHSSQLCHHLQPTVAAHAPPADDSFRAKFLWGRRPMLAACAARLRDNDGMVSEAAGGPVLGVPTAPGQLLHQCVPAFASGREPSQLPPHAAELTWHPLCLCLMHRCGRTWAAAPGTTWSL